MHLSLTGLIGQIEAKVRRGRLYTSDWSGVLELLLSLPMATLSAMLRT